MARDIRVVHAGGSRASVVLGRGGMGVVCKARHLRLNQVVALKMILAGWHSAANERVRFLAEQLARGIYHAHTHGRPVRSAGADRA